MTTLNLKKVSLAYQNLVYFRENILPFILENLICNEICQYFSSRFRFHASGKVVQLLTEGSGRGIQIAATMSFPPSGDLIVYPIGHFVMSMFGPAICGFWWLRFAISSTE